MGTLYSDYFEAIGSITQDYAVKNDRYKSGAHTGIDIKLDDNRVKAFVEGTVTEAKYNKYYGNYVKVRDILGYSHLYAHMQDDSIEVKPSQYVQKGQNLGIMGSTGNSTGNHLHYEVRNMLNSLEDPGMSSILQSKIDDIHNNNANLVSPGMEHTGNWLSNWFSGIVESANSWVQKTLLWLFIGALVLGGLKVLFTD